MERTPRPSRLFRATVLSLLPAMAALPARAALDDLSTVTCTAAATNSETFENDAAINEQILALTNPAGANVFWVLGPPSASGFTCDPVPPTGFATGITCSNGLEIELPPGASATASVIATQPVTVAAPIGAAIGSVTFSLTATRDDDTLAACAGPSPDPALLCGTLPSCQNFYEVEILEPKEPFDLMFVLDRSGSMSATTPGGTRWTALTTGVETFLPFIQTAASPPTPPGSRFGLTLFESGVLDPGAALFDIVQSGTSTPTPQFSAVPGTLAAEAPGGATAMGAGLEDGLAKATDASRIRSVALFTDGEQNVDPLVSDDGCEIGTDPINASCPAIDGYRICSVGIGSPADDYLRTLFNLAQKNRGATILANNGMAFSTVSEGAGGTFDVVNTDIAAAFQQCIGDLLQDNSPQQVAFYAGPFVPDQENPGPVTLDPFEVNRKVDRVMLSITLSSRFEVPQIAQILGRIRVERDGSDVTELFRPVIFGSFPGVITLVADFTGPEAEPPEGAYTVTLELPPNFRQDLQYRLVPYVEDRRVTAASELSASVAKVNGAIDVGVDLAWLGEGIAGADVVVRAFGPGADMGELLSQGGPIELAGGPDAATAGIQKYDARVASDPAFLDALKLSPNAIAMTDEGNGRYTGSYAIPDNVGAVHFVYDVVATDPRFGTIQRSWVESAYGAIDGVDMAASNPTSTFLDGVLTLTFKPLRPGGNLVGPGQLSSFTFDGATLQQGVDLQDGTYTFDLGTTDPDAPIEIGLADDTIYTGPAGWGTIERDDDILSKLLKLPLWIWILLILLLLLLLYWLFRRPGTP